MTGSYCVVDGDARGPQTEQCCLTESAHQPLDEESTTGNAQVNGGKPVVPNERARQTKGMPAINDTHGEKIKPPCLMIVETQASLAVAKTGVNS